MRRIQGDVTSSGGIGSGAYSAPDAARPKETKKPAITSFVPGDSYVGPPPKANTTPISELVPVAEPQHAQQPGVSTPEGFVFPSDRPILLFNSDCSVCRKISSWVIASDDPKNGGHQKIDERPIGYDPDALKKLNPHLDIWDAYSTIHILMPDGSMKTGGEAVAEVLRRLPQTATASKLLDFSLFGWKPFQGAVNVGYVVLDKLRPALGCESCGKPVPWWGKPIHWAFQKLTGP